MDTAMNAFLITVGVGLGIAVSVLAIGWAAWLVARKWTRELLKMPSSLESAIAEADAQNEARYVGVAEKTPDRTMQ